VGARIDRHGASDEILADLGELDAERSHQRAGTPRIQDIERKPASPDAQRRILKDVP
jgi:hypothetical protein